jgi:OmpA-OmpF porin, OOP family
MRITRLFLIVAFMMSGSVMAHDGGFWGNGSSTAWKTGFGDCWNASKGIDDGACGGMMAAPAPAPSNTIYWNDEDGDGVLDADDACPKTPLGVPVDSSGCINDNDGDGVPDYLDQCPETPLGNVVDTDGCSLALVKLQGVHFKFDSATLTYEAKSILDRSLAAIKSNPSQNISVEGHTDSAGSDSYNLDLSQRRAQSVVDYLTSKGVSGSRLNAKGFGESNPISSNDTSVSRAQNRRVEIFAR